MDGQDLSEVGTVTAPSQSRRAHWIVGASAGFLAVCVAFFRLGLWHADLRVPVHYNGDALFELVYVKALTEHAWYYYIPELGAPFGVYTIDWPVGRSLDYALMKLLSLAVHDPFLLVNVFWLLSIALAGAFAALFFSHLRVGRVWAVLFGVLYALIPFTFYRNIAHLCLMHFMVPGAAYLGFSLAQGKRLFFRKSDIAPARGPAINLWVAVAACLAAGLTFPYWAFFSCMFIAIGCVIGVARTKSKAVLFAGVIFIAFIGCAKVADLTPSLLHWYRHGQSTALDYRSEAEADTYGLTIRQMLTPIAGHPLPPMRWVRDKVFAAGFPNDRNESSAANLGLIGAVGFVLLVIAAVARPPGSILGDDRVRIFAGFVVALVLIADVGGLGSLFNVFVLRTFRDYNRVSPFINLLSLGTIAILFDRVFRGARPLLKYAIAAITLGFGAVDQVPHVLADNRIGDRQRFYSDREFITKVESHLVPGSMVFELPDISIPAVAPFGTMDMYDNVRPYLHSKTLRWSWGALVGRHDDWARKTALLKAPELLEQLAWANFAGVLLDRAGYSNNTLEQGLVAVLRGSPTIDSGRRWVFFDIRDFRAKLLSGLPPADVVKREQASTGPASLARYKLGERIYFGQSGDSDRFKVSGWSSTEPEFTWTEGNSAVLRLADVSTTQPLTLKMTLSALTSDPVTVYANGIKITEWRVSTISAQYEAVISSQVIDPDGRLDLKFTISKPVSPKDLGTSPDSRMLGICVRDLVIAPGK